MKNLILTALIAFSANCSFRKNPLVNQTHKGHEELYSEPEAPKKFESQTIKRIVVAATNDIEGHYKPQQITFKDEHHPNPQNTVIGGADAMSGYFKILRDNYENVILVDSGDIFSSKVSLKEVRNFYSENKYDALTVGVSDFNLKLPKNIPTKTKHFSEFSKDANVPLLISNLLDVKTGRVAEWKGAAPYIIKELDGVKVGIIGIIPDDITSLTPVNNRVGLFVEDMITNTLRQARLLRSLGAELIVVISHQGLQCGHELAQESKLPLSKVNFEPSKKDVCDLSNPLGTYLERLPPHLVDVVVAGRTHTKIANYVNDTLVISNFGQGQSMIYAEFFVDTVNKKVLKEQTIVHQPVIYCREFFKATKDCYTEDPTVNHSERVPATFLGTELQLQAPKSVTKFDSKNEFSIGNAIDSLSADIAFIPPTSGDSQLINVKISGFELIKLLEEDYNTASSLHWYPSPFIKKDKLLQVKIQGEDIDGSREYVILADIEGIREQRSLAKLISKDIHNLLPHYSWSSFESKDAVSTKLSAHSR